MTRVKDRARPFARKHARYWLTAAGGMVVIMALNLALGFWIYGQKPAPMPTAHYPPVPPFGDAGVPDAGVPDAGVPDAGADAAAAAPTPR